MHRHNIVNNTYSDCRFMFANASQLSFSSAARHTFTNKTRQNRFCHILFAMCAYRYSNITFIFSMNISQSMYEIISCTLYIYRSKYIYYYIRMLSFVNCIFFKIYKRIKNKILCQQKSSLMMRLCYDLATQ